MRVLLQQSNQIGIEDCCCLRGIWLKFWRFDSPCRKVFPRSFRGTVTRTRFEVAANLDGCRIWCPKVCWSASGLTAMRSCVCAVSESFFVDVLMVSFTASHISRPCKSRKYLLDAYCHLWWTLARATFPFELWITSRNLWLSYSSRKRGKERVVLYFRQQRL